MSAKTHEHYMRRAIELAGRNPGAPFGAVLVDDRSGEIVAEGLNRSQENPVLHGEIDAITRCAAEHPGIEWSRLRLYTTAEPCCMCQGAILWAGIGAVFYGTSIRRLVELGWKQIDIFSDEVTQRTPFADCRIEGGILADECEALFRR